MAAQYGDHFGWRTNVDDMRVTEGTLKSPTGTPLKQGTVVTRDPANAGYLKVAADASGEIGQVGLLQQDDIQFARSDFDPALLDSEQLGTCKPDHRSVMVSGPGMAFWVQNSVQRTRYTRTFPAQVRWDAAALTAEGDLVGWDGSKFIKVTDRNLALGYVKRFETTDRVVVTLIK